MSLGKAFQTVTVFIIIPLMLAVHSNKIPLTAALDIIVWYIAISFGIFIFKTPIKLYFTVKEKCKYLKELQLDLQQLRQHQQSPSKDKTTPPSPAEVSINKSIRELYALEWKLLLLSLLCPFLALSSWYGLEQFCLRYSLSTLSQLLHPYFIIVASFVSSYQPIFYFVEHFKERIDEVHPPPGPSHAHSALPKPGSPGMDHRSPSLTDTEAIERMIRQKIIEHLQAQEEKHAQEMKKQEKEYKATVAQLQNELAVLKRDIRDWTQKKTNQIITVESRMLSLENQIELAHLVERERNERQALSSSTSSLTNPLKALYNNPSSALTGLIPFLKS